MAAPSGGGGGGGPVGFANSFTGAASGLDIYGDFAAAYSGAIQASDSAAVTHLEFISGNYLFVGTIDVYGQMKVDSVSDGGIGIAEIQFNGKELFNIKVETGQEDMPAEVSMPILIPAYTEVSIALRSEYGTAGSTTSVNLIGRIYRE